VERHGLIAIPTNFDKIGDLQQWKEDPSLFHWQNPISKTSVSNPAGGLLLYRTQGAKRAEKRITKKIVITPGENKKSSICKIYLFKL
jgi:hypothetical protein